MRINLSFFIVVAIVSSVSLSAASTLVPLPTGVWRTSGYGYIFDANAGKLTIYDESRAACIFNSVSEGPTADEYIGKAELDPAGNHAVLHAGISLIPAERLKKLPRRCRQSPADADPQHNFDVLWQTFDEHYAFFAKRNVDWNSIRSEYRPRAAAARSDDELFKVFSSMLARLKDAHVHLDAPEMQFQAMREQQPTTPDADGIVPTRRALQRALKDYVTGPSTPLLHPAIGVGQQRVWYGRLTPDTGYIVVFAMGGFEDEVINSDANAQSAQRVFQQIAADLAGVSGVVLDLRYNQGGYDPVSLALAGLFTDRAGLAFRKSARGSSMKPYAITLQPAPPPRLVVPVAVLISKYTVSAAESAAAMFRTLPNATLIGQPTEGALSDVLEKKLPNGWRVTLSNEIFLDADGGSPEGVGILPNTLTPVPAPASSDARFRPDISEALRWLDSRRTH